MSGSDCPCASGLSRGSFQPSDGSCLSYQYCDQRPTDCCSRYQDDGRPAIILISDMGYDSNYWKCLQDRLCPCANVFAVDLPGTGESDTIPLSSLTLTNLTITLHEWIVSLGFSKVYMVGQGFGGLLALQFSITYPAMVIKLVIVGANPRPYPGGDWPYPITVQLQNLLNDFMSPGAATRDAALALTELIDPVECDIKFRLACNYIMNQESYRIYTAVMSQINLTNSLAGVVAPTLIITGANDPYVPAGAAQYLATNIVGSSLITYEGQGHNVALFNNHLFVETVFDFFFVTCDPCCAYLESIPLCPPKRCGKAVDYSYEERFPPIVYQPPVPPMPVPVPVPQSAMRVIKPRFT